MIILNKSLQLYYIYTYVHVQQYKASKWKNYLFIFYIFLPSGKQASSKTVHQGALDFTRMPDYRVQMSVFITAIILHLDDRANLLLATFGDSVSNRATVTSLGSKWN